MNDPRPRAANAGEDGRSSYRKAPGAFSVPPERPARTVGGRPTSGGPTSGGPTSSVPTSRYLRAFGATSLLADQSRPALTVQVCESPAVGADSPMSLGSTWPSLPVLGVSSKM